MFVQIFKDFRDYKGSENPEIRDRAIAIIQSLGLPVTAPVIGIVRVRYRGHIALF